MAYGQTGAGKTYTMLGNREENGIIQRSLKDVFRLCDPETDSIGIAFYEIYNEKVFDLLSQSSLKGKFTDYYFTLCAYRISLIRHPKNCELKLAKKNTPHKLYTYLQVLN